MVIGFDILTQLYEDPSNLDLIRDPHLRMRARAFIVEVETEHRMASFDACTKEAQKLAQQFSEVRNTGLKKGGTVVSYVFIHLKLTRAVSLRCNGFLIIFTNNLLCACRVNLFPSCCLILLSMVW